MPETYEETVLREMRDHEGYTGDGRGGVGDLPIGDRSTARRPIDLSALRRVLLAGGVAVQEALDASQQAQDAAADAAAAAALAEDAMQNLQAATFYAADLPSLLANTDTFEVGVVFGTRKEGYSFEVVASSADAVTAGGVHLRRVRQDELAVMSERAAVAGADSARATEIRTRWNNTAPLIWSQVERVSPEWGGARGNNTQTATTRSALQAAANFSAREGKILNLKRGASYGINGSLTLPAGLVIEGEGAEIVSNYTTSAVMTAAQIEVGANTKADALNVRVASGIDRIQNVLRVAGGARIGVLSVVAESPIYNRFSGADMVLAAGILLRGNDIRIGKVVGSNFDGAMRILECDDLEIQDLQLSEFITGLTVEETRNLKLHSARLRGPSSITFGNAWAYGKGVMTPGANGLLLTGCADSVFNDLRTYNVFEHGTRVGSKSTGGTANLIANENLIFNNNHHYAPYGCGHKQDDGDSYDIKRITINGLYTEDVGHNNWFGVGGYQNWSAGGVNTPGTDVDGNKVGCAIRNSEIVQINGYINRARAYAASGHRGLWIERSDHVTGSNIQTRSSRSHGVVIQNGRDVNFINLNGVTTYQNGGDGLAIVASASDHVMRGISVSGLISGANTGYGFSATNKAGTGGPPFSTTASVFSGLLANNTAGGKNITAQIIADADFVDQMTVV